MSLEVAKFGVVGLINSALGVAAIFICMALGASDIQANFIGYSFGLMLSFVLNGKWTFNRTHLTQRSLTWFMVVTAVAYGANVATLLLVRDTFGWGSTLSQLAGIAPYTLIGFFGMKFIAFKNRPLKVHDTND